MGKTWCETSATRDERARSLTKHLPTRAERECVEWLLETVDKLKKENAALAEGMRNLSAVCRRRWDMLREAAGRIPRESELGQMIQDELDESECDGGEDASNE